MAGLFCRFTLTLEEYGNPIHYAGQRRHWEICRRKADPNAWGDCGQSTGAAYLND